MRRGYAAGLRRHGCQTGPARKQTPMRRLCGGTSPGPCGGPCRPLGPPRASIGPLYLCAEGMRHIYIYIYAKSTHNIRLCAKLCGAYIYIYIYVYIRKRAVPCNNSNSHGGRVLARGHIYYILYIIYNILYILYYTIHKYYIILYYIISYYIIYYILYIILYILYYILYIIFDVDSKAYSEWFLEKSPGHHAIRFCN